VYLCIEQNAKDMTYLNIEQIANQLPQRVREFFTASYKGLVNMAINDGNSVKQANRIAFDILIKDGALLAIDEMASK
jgi:hypothetical protein